MSILDNPQVRYALRVALFGVAAALGSLQAGGSWRDIVVAGLVSALGYAGIGAATPVEPSVGIGKK